MIAQFVKRGVLLGALFGMVFAMVPAGALAHPVVAPIPACDGPSRTPEEIAALQPDLATPFVQRERQRVERVGEASDEEIAAIAETVAGWFACIQTRDAGRTAAFLTDAAVASGNFSLSFDDDLEPLTEVDFFGVFGAWALSDGRIAALIALDETGQNYPVISAVLIFAHVDGRWLIDDFSF